METQESVDDSQLMISDKEFNDFLDFLMGKLYDIVQAKRPDTITPAITMYRKHDYGEPFDIRSAAVPLVPVERQNEIFNTMGRTAAELNDGRVPVATFLSTLGVKAPALIDGELTQEVVDKADEEVIIIAGATLDGRICQAVYTLQRDAAGHISEVDLNSYIPCKHVTTVKPEARVPLLDTFYAGFQDRYITVMEERRKQNGGQQYGNIIIPD